MLLFDEPAERDITFAKPDDGKTWSQVAREAASNLTDIVERPGVYKRVFDASWQAQTYVENSNARQWSQAESVERLIKAVESSSGVKLPNPTQGGFQAEAETAARERIGEMYGPAVARAPDILNPFRQQAFDKRLQELVDSDPKIADAVATARIDFSPHMITRRAEEDLQAAMAEASSGIGAFGAAIGGGIVPSFRDPINAAGLFLGGGPSAAKSVAGRIGVVALREAAINAGITTLQQPFTQDWRREAGLEAGLKEAMANIAMAAGVGGAFGAGAQAGRDLLGLLASGRIKPGDVEAGLRAAGVALPEEEGAALRAAVRADADDALALRGIPRDVPGVESGEVMRQALRYAEDPVNQPPPDLPIALPKTRADRAAVLDESLPAAIGDVATVDGKPVAFERFDPMTIGTDAAAMQYKGGADAAGVTDRLRSVQRWDPLAGGRIFVFERADGARVVADGHQRLGLARRLTSESEPAELVGHLFRERDGWTAADVRALAAKKNMQEGSGTALDAARVLRDRPDLADGALPISGPMMRNAVMLARLSDEAFAMVNAGVVPEAFGARIGAMVADPLQHAAVLADLARLRPETEREASILIGESLRAGFVTERQEDMFGALERSVSLMGERVKVLDQAVRQLATDKRVFGLLGREAPRIEGAGNQLVESNAARSAAAAEMQQLVVTLAQRMGPISDLLTAAARDVKEGGRATEAARGFLDNVAQAIEREGLPRLMSDPSLRPAQAIEPGTPQALAAAERVELGIDAVKATLREKGYSDRQLATMTDEQVMNSRAAISMLEKQAEYRTIGETLDASASADHRNIAAEIAADVRANPPRVILPDNPQPLEQRMRARAVNREQIAEAAEELLDWGRTEGMDREATIRFVKDEIEQGNLRTGDGLYHQDIVDHLEGRHLPTIDHGGDLFGDVLPVASRDDPMGTRMVSREEALAEAEKTGFAADLVAACKAGG